MTSTPPTSLRRIGLLGGSFNPAHEGHRDISLAALDRLRIDAVWWIVSPASPLKNEADYAPFEDRLARTRQVANHPDIVVSDFERRHNLRYTVDTIERLQLVNPDTKFVWLMGADSLATFHLWQDWKKIAELVPMAVFNRPGYEEPAFASEAGQYLGPMRLNVAEAPNLADAEPPAWIFFSDTDNPLSSTALRG